MAGTAMRMRLHRGILIYRLSFALHATAGGAHSVTASFSLLSPPPPVCAMLLQADISKRNVSFQNLPQSFGHYGDLTNIVRMGCGDTTYTYMYENLCLAICLQDIPSKTHENRTKTVRKPCRPYIANLIRNPI